MCKYVLLVTIFLLSPFFGHCAISDAEARPVFSVPGFAAPGQKIRLQISGAEPLPASSFYRVELECPQKPADAAISAEMGYPESDLVFDTPGKYECVAKFGIITRSSCAGVRYRHLADYRFEIEIKPE